MKYLPLFYSYTDTLSVLTDEQLGRVIRAALAYMQSGTEPQLEPVETLAFGIIKRDAERSADKYEETCQKRREAANKRWEQQKQGLQSDANASTSMQMDANADFAMQTDAKDAKDKGQRVKDKGKTSSYDDVSVESSDEATTPHKSKSKKKEYAPLPPPTVEEVRAYCNEKGITNVNPQYFVDYYSAALPPWTKANGEPVKNWKLTVVTWSQRPGNGYQQPQQTSFVPPPDDYPF